MNRKALARPKIWKDLHLVRVAGILCLRPHDCGGSQLRDVIDPTLNGVLLGWARLLMSKVNLLKARIVRRRSIPPLPTKQVYEKSSKSMCRPSTRTAIVFPEQVESFVY